MSWIVIIFLLPPDDYEVVVEIEWLRTLGDVLWNFLKLTMKFTLNRRRETFQGKCGGNVITISSYRIEQTFKKGRRLELLYNSIERTCCRKPQTCRFGFVFWFVISNLSWVLPFSVDWTISAYSYDLSVTQATSVIITRKTQFRKIFSMCTPWSSSYARWMHFQYQNSTFSLPKPHFYVILYHF